MSKSINQKTEEIKPKKEKKMKKFNIETIKTVIIAILITGILAFIGGVLYEHSAEAATSEMVKSIKVEVQPSKQ